MTVAGMDTPLRTSSTFALAALALAVGGAWLTGHGADTPPDAGIAANGGLPQGEATLEQVLRGRRLVVTRDCGGCHGGGADPTSPVWLAGISDEPIFQVNGFPMWARNLTPDAETGLGGVSERQIFNALRYGLRPRETPDMEITSTIPGQGNFPEQPRYLAPGMPWLYWRFMPDTDLWAIAAYLKHGLKPVVNPIPAGESPPDHWAAAYTPEQIGPAQLPPFPTAREQAPPPEKLALVLRGRQVAAEAACSGCHGGAIGPQHEGWMDGMRDETFEFNIAGFRTRPRNITPHNTMGIGRFSERQLFNSLRYGLRPGETADRDITSHTPGMGNFPRSPKFMAPPMPWPAWRHMPDEDLWALAAYLKHGVKPVANRVADSEGPPDFWESRMTEIAGPYPLADFPTDNERPLATAKPRD